MWAGVQNVSRPIVMCHEMSHSRPTMMLVDPASIAVRYHGSAAARSTRGRARAGWATDSMDESSSGLQESYTGFWGKWLQGKNQGLQGRQGLQGQNQETDLLAVFAVLAVPRP